ncbi:MAG TPA: hypothetical protein VFV78_09625 [Vicinamibacterales bacterium]|nr:hypothetical protein [Vicinamibacterales bacterium]
MTPVLVFVMATLALAFRPPIGIDVDAHIRQDRSLPARFTATATNLDPSVRLTATLVEFNVTRWSTEAERERLLSVLVDKGQDKLLRTLQDIPRVGTMKTPDTLSYDLHYARLTREGDQDHIVLVTDRPIAIWEQANLSRTVDYPFTIIEMRLDPSGRGEGKITVATKIIAGKNGQIVLENYGNQPVRLTNVKRER